MLLHCTGWRIKISEFQIKMMDNFYEAEEFPDSEFEDLSQSQSLSESSGSEYQPDQDQESEQGSASLTMDSQVCAKTRLWCSLNKYFSLRVCLEMIVTAPWMLPR